MNLFQYIRGNRTGKEINRLEKEAMRNFFLADALEGFDKIKRDDHERRIEEMRAKVLHKTASGNRRYLRRLSVAASILLITGFGTYFLLNRSRPDTEKNPAETKFDLYVSEKSITENEDFISDKTLRKDPPPEIKIQPGKTPATQTGTNIRRKTATPVIAAVRQAPVNVNKEIRNETEELQVEKTVMQETAPSENKISMKVMAMKSPGEEDGEAPPVETGKNRVKGIVTDLEGHPLVGASVRYDNTVTGVVSDTNGYFELPLAPEKNIRIDYIGYKPLHLLADTDRTMLAAMEEDDGVLDEVIVVGYGKQKKGRKTGGISAVKTKNIQSKPVVGRKEYKNYLKKNAIMPQGDDCKGKKGKVKLAFTVDREGRPANIRIKRSLCPEADREAIRLIEQGPGWTAGSSEVEVEVKFRAK
ncbi:MAG: carboxypeptidase-like regulatory domain-containing protein [Tannerella sp.]|jgi:TonB family protein|nr:carboxypeptidase-like regulatory domain-containing protein [Tannerella sp.]